MLITYTYYPPATGLDDLARRPRQLRTPANHTRWPPNLLEAPPNSTCVTRVESWGSPTSRFAQLLKAGISLRRQAPARAARLRQPRRQPRGRMTADECGRLRKAGAHD